MTEYRNREEMRRKPLSERRKISLKYGVKGYNEDYDEDFYDDDAPRLTDDTYGATPVKKEKKSTNEEILEKLDIVLDKLAKLERAFQAGAQPQKSSLIIEPIQEKHEPVIPKTDGSMLREIQEMIGQMPTNAWGSPVGEMSQGTTNMTPMLEGTNQPAIQPDVMSSVAILPTSAYDDDVPNILGLD